VHAALAKDAAWNVRRAISDFVQHTSARSLRIRTGHARADEPIDPGEESALFAQRGCMLRELVKTSQPWREAAADHHGTISFEAADSSLLNCCTLVPVELLHSRFTDSGFARIVGKVSLGECTSG
jgi:hypothetical protein